jgi:uncharacterized membrane protein
MSPNMLANLLGAPIIALIFLGLSWGWAKSIRRGRPLTPLMKLMLAYSSLVVLGTIYAMAYGDPLGPIFHVSPNRAWIPESITWAFALGGIAWWHHKRNERLTGEQHPKVPVRVYISVGLPFLGVLASLIMSAIEWNFVAEGQGHLWQALAWTAASAACIRLAGKKRRVVIVMAFRVFLVLGVIGAIGHPTAAALVAVGVVAVAYFLIERLWPKHSDPAVLDFEALSQDKSD